MPSPPRLLFAGAHYHVICRGNNRSSVFTDNSDRLKYLTILRAAKPLFSVRFFSYALMDNHVHLYLTTQMANLSEAMFWISKRYSDHFNSRHGRTGHLFGARFKSRIVQKDRYALALVRYIHLNPVKAGMVETPETYPWSSHHEFLESGQKNSPEPLCDCSAVLEHFGTDEAKILKNYRDFIKTPVPPGEWAVLAKTRNGTLGDRLFRNSLTGGMCRK
ncbi:MAG: transposase [bacterium]